MNPLRFRAPEEFAALREVLRAADFTGPAVCRRVEIESIYDFRSIREGRTVALELGDRLDLLIRLFMDVELIDRQVIEGLLSAPAVATLERFGLLCPFGPDPARAHAAVLLYPAESLWIVSDLNVSPVGPRETALQEDAVYPAITRNTRHFLASLPTSPCDNFLELCAGTGIAALLAARYAGQTWAADITERSTWFARFNAALNGISNCAAVQGDLYQPVTGQVFDRIVAHPPYMPSLEQKYIFRDGGEDGEQITRRIIAGLPEHLSPGGRFYCTCMLTDRRTGRAEERIRAMLGARADEFDVVVVTFQTFQPTEYYFRLALAGRATLDEVGKRHEIFGRLEVEQLVYCSVVIQRAAAARPAFTVRRQAGPTTGASEIEWLLSWESSMTQNRAVEGLLEACPDASPHTRLRLTQVLRADAWVADECVLTTTTPFALEAKCPPWTAGLVARCDGRRTTREHLQRLKQDGDVPSDAPETEFVKLIRSLIAGGFLQVADPLSPAPPGRSQEASPLLDTARRSP
jgi:methylase of polypeptide subunit release factors